MIKLTENEKIIVYQISLGKPVKTIAYNLGIHVKSVDYQAKKARLKCECISIVQLVAYCLRNGIIQ